MLLEPPVVAAAAVLFRSWLLVAAEGAAAAAAFDAAVGLPVSFSGGHTGALGSAPCIVGASSAGALGAPQLLALLPLLLLHVVPLAELAAFQPKKAHSRA